MRKGGAISNIFVSLKFVSALADSVSLGKEYLFVKRHIIMFDACRQAGIQIHFPLVKGGRVFALDHDVFFNPVGHDVLDYVHVGQDSGIDDSRFQNFGGDIIYFLGKGGSELHPITVFCTRMGLLYWAGIVKNFPGSWKELMTARPKAPLVLFTVNLILFSPLEFPAEQVKARSFFILRECRGMGGERGPGAGLCIYSHR